ncbi:MAG TPA: two-component regulator propeller domain-containing protein [Chryseolinea sp.]|nr:two-component regulator propeller domain-containing protein [Chryseolinea sp.]HPM32764.1 two-component regulator propeller domain-containing protein [Chryseolinea sp.]
MKLLLIFLTFLSSTVFGQDIKLFDKSNSELVDNDLLSVTVDKNGNKWIGTSKAGLLMFDGQKFTIFNKNNSKIKGDYISPIHVDKKGNIWVSFSDPDDGIAKYDGTRWTVYNEKELHTDKVSVISICEDQNGVLYFGGENGVSIYKENIWSKLELPEGEFIVRAIDVGSAGSIAIGHNGGLLIYSENKWNSYTTENSNLKLGTVRAVKFKPNGNLIIGYGGGFGDGGFSIIVGDKWEHYNKSNSKIPDHMIRDIEIDANQIILMSTNNGVVKLSGSKITPIFFREGMYRNAIFDIALEKETVWIASNFGLIKYVP